MQTLNFLAVKAIAENLDLLQTTDLVKSLTKRLDQMKTTEIKRALIEKLQSYSTLNKFVPLVEKINSILPDEEVIIIEFNDNPRYQIFVDEGEQIRVYESRYNYYAFDANRRDGWRRMKRSDDPTTYDYLADFGNIFFGTFEMDDKIIRPDWGNNIRTYLALDETELKLLESEDDE